MNNNIMIDLETMDTAPTAAIVSIGAVKFNKKGILDEFYKVVDLADCVNKGLTMSPSTVQWWISQPNKTDTFDGYKSDYLNSVLLNFSYWIGQDARVWGNGSDFDNVILRNAYNAYTLTYPWKYYNNMCYRTMKNLAPNVKMVRSGNHHNALDDAKSQALHLIAICDHLGIQL